MAALLVLGLTVAAGSCSSDADDQPSAAPQSTLEPQPPSATTTTTAAGTTAGDDVIERYKQFWEVRFAANSEPVNPSDPRLVDYATGAQLENVVAETRQKQEQGLAIRRPDLSVYARRVRLVNSDGDTATLQDCVTNDGVLYQVGTGEVIDDAVVTRSLTATMRRIDGVWKLSDTRVLQEWEGVAGCALATDFS